jgi:6-phosphogluconolactonase (cycloisomerase 2 family)
MKKIILFVVCGLTMLACSPKNTTGIPLNQLLLLTGSYGEKSGDNIAFYTFDTLTADFELVQTVSGFINPSYLTVSPDEQLIYSVKETGDGGVYSLRFDKQTYRAAVLNTQAAGGGDPCYININKEKTFLVTANYTGGSLSVFPLSDEGSIRPVSQYLDMNLPGETDLPPSHIHTAVFSPDEKWLLATDLGKDKIYLFKVYPEAVDTFLIQDKEKTTGLLSGSGPRHLAFHPNGKFLYCINELSGTVAVFQYDDGKLATIQYLASDTTPGNGGKGSADIHISPDGRFLYSSNRLKADGIAVFSIHPDNGTLTQVAYQPTGIHPRNFIITPNGKFLLCANRDSNSIQLFEIDKETGLLRDTKKVIERHKPVCLKWIRL